MAIGVRLRLGRDRKGYFFCIFFITSSISGSMLNGCSYTHLQDLLVAPTLAAERSCLLAMLWASSALEAN